MTAASNETAPMPTIKTVTAIGSYSSQRNNIGKTLLSLLIFPDPREICLLDLVENKATLANVCR